MGLFTKKKNFIFNSQEEQAIIKAIKAAEDHTSGEIRIHVEPTCEGDSFPRAIEMFKQLDMHKTKLHNGVLIYIAYESHKFSIVADDGINAVVPIDFWENLKNLLAEKFKKGEFVAGLTQILELMGEQLKRNFPHGGDSDNNELKDDLSKS